jgi:hypothetical protein
MKKLSLGLVLAFLMLTTLSYAQSGNPTDNPTPASLALSTLQSNNFSHNDAQALFTDDCVALQPINNGQWDLTCKDPRITPSSSVFASISQYNPGTGLRVLGAATLVVENIVPLNGKVTVRVDVITDSPIYPWLTILVNP